MDAQFLSRLLDLENKKKLKKRRKVNNLATTTMTMKMFNNEVFMSFSLRKHHPKEPPEKKRQHEIRQLMKQAKTLIATFPKPEEGNNTTVVGGGKKKKPDDSPTIVGGAQPKPKENPLKKELANPAGLDFANQMGAILAQLTQINMVPPGDESRRAVQPEKIASGIKSETKKVLEPKATFTTLTCKDVEVLPLPAKEHFITFDFMVPMFTFLLSSLLPPLPVLVVALAINDTTFRPTMTFWQPILPMVPSLFPIDLLTFFKKATIELEGGIEIEPTNQTHQITKLVRFHMNTEAKYSTLGGYVKDYDSTLTSQKYQVPIAPDADGVMEPTAGGGNDYRTIQRTHFLEGTAGQPNAGFRYTTKGAAALSDKFNNDAEVHFQVPLCRICCLARCEQMLPTNKDYYITLHKMRESFLMVCQRAAVHQNLIFQITNCEIHIPIVELTPEKRQEE